MRKFVYVAEIIIELAKVILPFVKARQITIERDNAPKTADEPSEQ